MFKRAVKYAAKGRVALVGPAGSGKSYTMLRAAQALAGGKRIAAIDTEHGSLSKYADLFDFDVVEMESYTPQNFLAALKEAGDRGYGVFCCDSLSHFWVGKDGALEFVDERRARHKDQMAGWKDFRPHERAMVDAMLASACHVICTMRTKTDYQEQIDEHGRKKRVKIGLAPVQREGLEYEFDLVGYMDEDNTLIVDKTRCSSYSGRSIRKPDADAFAPFVTWLAGGSERPAPPPPPVKCINREQWAELRRVCFKTGCSIPKLLARYSVTRPGELPLDHYEDALGRACVPTEDLMSTPSESEPPPSTPAVAQASAPAPREPGDEPPEPVTAQPARNGRLYHEEEIPF